MTVVAVWAAEGAARLARMLHPTAPRAVEGEHAALLGGVEEVGEREARIGQPPTHSTISLSRERVLLERGAGWTAPIYYRVEPFLAASSNIAPLLRGGEELDVGRLASVMGYVMHRREDRTIYRAIRMVRPFETVVLSRAGCSSVERTPPQLAAIEHRTLDDFARELRELLFAAVDKAAANRRVGLLLGGVDSSSILAALLARRGARPDEITEVTLDFEAPGSDRPHVRALERHFGISVARITPARLSASDTFIVDGAPSRHSGDMGILECARQLHASGAQVLMTGTGGDEFFGGDFASAAALGILHGDGRGAWRAIRAQFPHHVPVRHRARSVAVALLRPHIPRAVPRRRAERRIPRLPAWMGPVLRSETIRAMREYAARPPSRSRDSFEAIATSPANSEHGAEIRAQFDAIMPIPRCDPLYDDELIRFLTGIPQQALFADGEWRGLLRRAMLGLLPESVRTRGDKSAFEPLLGEAVSFEQLKPLLTFQSLGAAGLVEPEGFRERFQPLYKAPRSTESGELWYQLWPALTTEAFLRAR